MQVTGIKQVMNDTVSRYSKVSKEKEMRIYVAVGEYWSAVPGAVSKQWVAEQVAVHMGIDPKDVKIGWSRTAGCSCGCSPAFIARGMKTNFSMYIDAVYESAAEEEAAVAARDEFIAKEIEKETKKEAARIEKAKAQIAARYR